MIRQKPDLAAADDVATSAAGFESFSGTSAAAPHAATIAALLNSYNPPPTPHRLRTILTTTAFDIMSAGVDRDAGFGIVMATAALQAAPADALLITPGGGLAFNRPVGAPYVPVVQTFSLANSGTSSFNWNLVNTSAWLTVLPTSGTLTSGFPAISVIATLN